MEGIEEIGGKWTEKEGQKVTDGNGIELNPAYVDVAVARWQNLTGKEATLAESDESFADLKEKRIEA